MSGYRIVFVRRSYCMEFARSGSNISGERPLIRFMLTASASANTFDTEHQYPRLQA